MKRLLIVCVSALVLGLSGMAHATETKPMQTPPPATNMTAPAPHMAAPEKNMAAPAKHTAAPTKAKAAPAKPKNAPAKPKNAPVQHTPATPPKAAK